jgi:MFS family permease
VADRHVMLIAAAGLFAALFVGSLVHGYAVLLALWFLVGMAYSAAQTPSGRLLRRSAAAEDRPALFAAQFALSHACWLITYPLAGWLGAKAGLPWTFIALSLLAAAAVAVAAWVWPVSDPDEIEHVHRELAPDHPHLAGAAPSDAGGFRHRHAFVIDSHHPEWPRSI